MYQLLNVAALAPSVVYVNEGLRTQRLARTRSFRPSPATFSDVKRVLKGFGFAPGVRADYAASRVSGYQLTGGVTVSEGSTTVRCALVGLIPTVATATLDNPRQLNYFTEVTRWRADDLISTNQWNACSWDAARSDLLDGDHGYADLWGFAPYYARSTIGPVPAGGNLLLAATRVIMMVGGRGGVRVDYLASGLRGLLSWPQPPTLWNEQDHRLACGIHTMLRTAFSPETYLTPEMLGRLATYVSGNYPSLVELYPFGTGCQLDAPDTSPSAGSRLVRGATMAVTGAGTGAAFGGWGALAGAAVGFAIGVLS